MNYNPFTRPVRYAVLVGGLDTEQKLGVEGTIHDLAKEFQKRGFRIALVTNAIAGQLERVLTEVETLCQRAERLPKVIFYYCGHHGEPGFQLVDGIYKRDELFYRLKQIRGERLGIFDCCHAGIMNRFAGNSTTILAASNEDDLAYACTNKNGNKRLILGEEIIEFMQGNPEKFSLGRLFKEIERDLQNNGWQVPELRGDRAFQIPGKC